MQIPLPFQEIILYPNPGGKENILVLEELVLERRPSSKGSPLFIELGFIELEQGQHRGVPLDRGLVFPWDLKNSQQLTIISDSPSFFTHENRFSFALVFALYEEL